MRIIYSSQPVTYVTDSVKISHNSNYPIWHLEDLLFPLFDKHYTYESLRETILSANHIWCAYEYGKCIGCALTTDIGSQGGLYIILFGIKQSEQGRGVGKRLLGNIIQWSRQFGYRFIYLHADHANKKAIHMYEKAGFREEYQRSNLTQNFPCCGLDVLAMILFLI